jgi:hypothetical protein
MRWFEARLWLLCGLLAGCLPETVSSSTDDGRQTKPCSARADCRHNAPECVEGACVECTEANQAACSGSEAVCKTGGNECVQCNDGSDCAEDAPHCSDDNTCGQCESDEDCGRWNKICDGGQCVQCTPQTEKEQCPDLDSAPGDQGAACDPVAKTCTGHPRGSVSGCGACVSDSECEEGSRCLKTVFGAAPYGSYCLEIAPSETDSSDLCPNGAPSKQAATSALGVDGEYCFPAETTCEAISDFKRECSQDSDCGAIGTDDGFCRANRCTYKCSGDPDCPGLICTGPVGKKYCKPD